jgi:ubiquinone/menaquinone biosynthesis C-methylase UbiE
VLDIGCGTGTLALMAMMSCPDCFLVELDADWQVLRLGPRKLSAGEPQVTFEQGMAFHLAHPDNSIDRVLCSLRFHHLDAAGED